MTSAEKKVGFGCLETGWLLSATEAQVRSRLRKGVLAYVVAPRLIDPLTVWLALPGEGRDLRIIAFEALLVGRIAAPRPSTRYGKPASLMAGLLPLMAEWNGYTVHKTSERC